MFNLTKHDRGLTSAAFLVASLIPITLGQSSFLWVATAAGLLFLYSWKHFNDVPGHRLRPVVESEIAGAVALGPRQAPGRFRPHLLF